MMLFGLAILCICAWAMMVVGWDQMQKREEDRWASVAAFLGLMALIVFASLLLIEVTGDALR